MIAIGERGCDPIRVEHPPQWQGDRWTQVADLQPEEQIYGLGERATAANLRAATEASKSKQRPSPQPEQQPKTYRIWNYDPGNIYEPGTDPMYICIPVYIGLRQTPPGEHNSYPVFYENTFEGEFTFGEQATATFEQGALRYYLSIGEPTTLLDRYTRLTGRPSLPPYWALGYHQSRWGYRTEAAVRQEIETFWAHNLPISAVHLDIDCQVNHRAFTIDPQRFPQFAKMTEDFASRDIQVVAINNPGIKYSRQSNLLLEGEMLGAFCMDPDGELVKAPVWAGQTVFPDFTNPRVRHWWSRQFAYLLELGVQGFWQDMNEPAIFIAWGDPTLPKSTQHHLEGGGGDHREAHNIYGLLEARSAYEGIRQHCSQQRPFLVSRSGAAGLQRYSWTWTGDIVSTWEALRQTIPTILGLGLSGIPFCGPDIGGFLGNPGAELYLRWFQMSTFFMFYRTHCATSVSPRAPWTFGEPYLSIIRQFLQLRYRLRPYFYTLAWEAAKQGTPPVRPLFWTDPTNPDLWGVEDAFCLGTALLIYPVLQQNAASRSIRLPPGDWVNFWDDTCLKGAQTVQSTLSLEQIPVFVKSGSVIPMMEDSRLTLHLYVSSEQELDRSRSDKSFLYSDAGDGYGASRLDCFQLASSKKDDNASSIEMIWEQEGDYDPQYDSVTYQVHGVAIKTIWVNGQAVQL